MPEDPKQQLENCPVCGKAFVERVTYTATVDGRTQTVCSDTCRRRAAS